MKTGTWSVKNCSLLALLILMALPGVGLAQPTISALSFTPAAINTSAGPAGVTVNFSLTDSSSGISYFETAFIDPFGSFGPRASKTFTPSGSITDSVALNFPRFSISGTWNLAYVFLQDAAGNTLFLDSNGLAAAGFTTALSVSSTADTTPPNITAFTLTPATIDTTAASAGVTVSFTLTDDLAGVNFFQAVLVSPSGNSSQTATKSFTPATTVTDSVALTFPRFSEAGTWTVSAVFVSDAAGNTLPLATPDLTARGFPTTLTVTSTSDTTPPTLTAFGFTPTSINVTGFPATVTVNYQVTDDLSGAKTVQAVFLSPSGATTQTASASFAASTSVTGTANVTFPKGSENGTWTVATVFLSDASGNTVTLATSDLVARSFPTQLMVTNAAGDTTPPVIVPTVNPAPNSFGWNTTVPVTVSWSVTDPESGINSSSGCGNSTVSAETSGVTFTCSATNNAGLTSSVSVTVRVDLTPPIVTPSVSPSPNAAGWNNTNVGLSWTATDPTSGVAADATSGCDPMTLTAETPGTTVTCTATNGAGLMTSVSVTIKIDKTPPTAVASATPAPNGAGWNNTNVTVSFSGTDSLSGIASCSAPVTLSSEGAGLSASGTCTDRAGNVSAVATASGINIDKTPPVIVPTVSPAPNAAGWNNTSPVTVSWSVTEPSPGSSITSSSGCTTSTVTAPTSGTTFTCTATNIAGLTNTVSVTVKLDTTPPVTTATPAPGTPPPGFPLATANATAVIKNTSGGTVGTITVTCYDTAGLFINLNATDTGGSGVASLTYAATGAQIIASTTVNGASATTPLISNNGLTTLTFAAKDVAGNQEATKSESILAGRGDDGFAYACAAPTPTFTIPTHGSVAASGTVVISGQTYPFSKTISY
jgi:hypothetical protein